MLVTHRACPGPYLPPAPAAQAPDCEQAAKDLPNNSAIAAFKKCATPTSISDDCCKTVGARLPQDMIIHRNRTPPHLVCAGVRSCAWDTPRERAAMLCISFDRCCSRCCLVDAVVVARAVYLWLRWAAARSAPCAKPPCAACTLYIPAGCSR